MSHQTAKVLIILLSGATIALMVVFFREPFVPPEMPSQRDTPPPTDAQFVLRHNTVPEGAESSNLSSAPVTRATISAEATMPLLPQPNPADSTGDALPADLSALPMEPSSDGPPSNFAASNQPPANASHPESRVPWAAPPRDLRLSADHAVIGESTGVRRERAIPCYHRVVDGDTLVTIAEKYYGDRERATELFERNRSILERPDVLPLGVQIVLPPNMMAIPRGPGRDDTSAEVAAPQQPAPQQPARQQPASDDGEWIPIPEFRPSSN